MVLLLSDCGEKYRKSSSVPVSMALRISSILDAREFLYQEDRSISMDWFPVRKSEDPAASLSISCP